MTRRDTFEANISKTDRLLRGVLGAVLFLNTHQRPNLAARLGNLLGGYLVSTSIAGIDPVLKHFGASTLIGAEDSVANQLKHALPGQGIAPMQTEQPVPQHPDHVPVHSQGEKTILEATSIG